MNSNNTPKAVTQAENKQNMAAFRRERRKTTVIAWVGAIITIVLVSASPGIEKSFGEVGAPLVLLAAIAGWIWWYDTTTKGIDARQQQYNKSTRVDWGD